MKSWIFGALLLGAVVMTPFTPPKPAWSFSATERAAIVEFVRNGGRVLVVAEEERRMDLAARGVCRDIGSRDVNEAQPEGC